MNLLGIFTFSAPYLPWVQLAFTVLLNNIFPAGDLLGMAVAHVYYFLEDIYPGMANGRRVLATPAFLKWIVESAGVSGDPGNAALPDRWDDTAPGEEETVEEVAETVLDDAESTPEGIRHRKTAAG